MEMYRVLMDSIKLFFMNVFLYAIFLEGYVFFLLLEQRLNQNLPFFEIFFAGFATFLAIVIWMHVSRVWFQRVKSHIQMFVRVMFSEIPFILLIGIFWIMASEAALPRTTLGLLLMFSWYIVLFPLVFHSSKAHTKSIEYVK